MVAQAFNGPETQAAALQMQPSLTLSFYPFGVILRRPTENGGFTEFPVDPAQVASVLAARTLLDTGILDGNTLCVRVEGIRRIVVGYRPPQRTALFIDGSDAPFRVPLPGLVMIRVTTGNEHPKYGIFAVKERPAALDVPLFQPPLPNIYAEGAVCWGSVTTVSAEALTRNDLAEDWIMFLGSPFTSHSVSGKSKCQPGDIRKQLADLDARKAKTYPRHDLVPFRATLADVLAKLTERSVA